MDDNSSREIRFERPPQRRSHRYVSTENVLERISVEDASHMPRVILSIGPCRSGTTASLRVYGEAGIKSYSQPIKGIYRHLAKGKPKEGCKWTIPSDDFIYMKETNGPFSCEESTLNPLDILSHVFKRSLSGKFTGDELAYQTIQTMRNKVHVVVMGRQPFDTWYSWEATFHNLMKGVEPDELWYYDIPLNSLFGHFISSYRNVEYLRMYARHNGIPVTHYVAEANREPEKALASLFKRTGMPMNPKISGWDDKSVLGAEGSNVIITADHSSQYRAGLFNRVNESDGITFFAGKGHELSDGVRRDITDAGLLQIYNTWRTETEKDLGIQIRAD